MTFLGQGALLSLSGDRRSAFLVRGVDKVEVESAGLLPTQLQHLAPQMWTFRAGLYLGENLEDKLVERFTTIRDYAGGSRVGRPTTAST